MQFHFWLQIRFVYLFIYFLIFFCLFICLFGYFLFVYFFKNLYLHNNNCIRLRTYCSSHRIWSHSNLENNLTPSWHQATFIPIFLHRFLNSFIYVYTLLCLLQLVHFIAGRFNLNNLTRNKDYLSEQNKYFMYFIYKNMQTKIYVKFVLDMYWLNPFDTNRCHTKSVFKRSTADWNSKFSILHNLLLYQR